MSLILRSNVASLRNMGSVSGLIGPQDYKVLADLSAEHYIRDSISVNFDDVLAFTRSSQAWLIGDDNSLLSFDVDEPRFTKVEGRRGLVVEPHSNGNAYLYGSNPQEYTSSTLSSRVDWHIRVWGTGSLILNALDSGDVVEESHSISPSDGYVRITVLSGRRVQFLPDNLDYVQVAPYVLEFIPRDGDAIPKAVETLSIKSDLLGLFSGSFSVLVNYAIDRSSYSSSHPILTIKSVSGNSVSARTGSRPGGGMLQVADYGSTEVREDSVPVFSGTFTVAVDRVAGEIKMTFGDSVVSGDLAADFAVSDLFIGSDPGRESATQTALAGIVRKVAIFDRALSDEELAVAKTSFTSF